VEQLAEAVLVRVVLSLPFTWPHPHAVGVLNVQRRHVTTSGHRVIEQRLHQPIPDVRAPLGLHHEVDA